MSVPVFSRGWMGFGWWGVCQSCAQSGEPTGQPGRQQRCKGVMPSSKVTLSFLVLPVHLYRGYMACWGEGMWWQLGDTRSLALQPPKGDRGRWGRRDAGPVSPLSISQVG